MESLRGMETAIKEEKKTEEAERIREDRCSPPKQTARD